MNILDLLQQDGIQPVDVSRGEWHSPCPECGGDDRFSCWPERANTNGKNYGGRFVCRGCGFNGDAVAYLQKRRGLSFRDACKALEIEPGQMPAGNHQQRRTWQPAAPGPAPPQAWQARARAFMDHCVEQLHSSSDALQWLQRERGLSIETVKAAHLGLNDSDKWEDRAAWGLPEEVSQKTGKPKKLWLPSGLVIPWRDDTGQVVRIRTRRSEPGQGARYVLAPGSFMGAMCLWQDQAAVAVVESELDALLLMQDAGELIGVVALGSAAMKPDTGLHERLMEAERVLICLDADDPGGKAAWGHWRIYSRFKRWPPIAGKDPGEMFKVGVSIRTWIQAGLS